MTDENLTHHVVHLNGLAYGQVDGRHLLLDIQHPDPVPATPAPLVVWIHGGGWEQGDRSLGLVASAVDRLVRDGFVAASIDYRLSDEATFPAQLHDVQTAVRWLRSNATLFGIDPDRIGVWGHSAGGHLAALLGTISDPPDTESEEGAPAISSRVQAVIPVSPPTDFLAIPPGWPHPEPRRAESKLIGGVLEQHPERVRLANPIAHIGPGCPPFLIIHGEADDIVPVEQSELLHDALLASRCASTFVRLPHADHGLAAPALGISVDAAWDDIGHRALTFFRKELRHG